MVPVPGHLGQPRRPHALLLCLQVGQRDHPSSFIHNSFTRSKILNMTPCEILHITPCKILLPSITQIEARSSFLPFLASMPDPPSFLSWPLCQILLLPESDSKPDPPFLIPCDPSPCRREENDIDESISMNNSLYNEVRGLEKQDLMTSIKYYEQSGMDSTALRNRLNEVSSIKIIYISGDRSIILGRGRRVTILIIIILIRGVNRRLFVEVLTRFLRGRTLLLPEKLLPRWWRRRRTLWPGLHDRQGSNTSQNLVLIVLKKGNTRNLLCVCLSIYLLIYLSIFSFYREQV